MGKAVQAGHGFGSLSEGLQYPQGMPATQMTIARLILLFSIT